LNQAKFEVPPLRERPRDVIPLALEFIQECCHENHLDLPHIVPDFLEALREYSWPGNVRELRNEVRYAVVFSRDGVLKRQDLATVALQAVRPRAAGSGAESRYGLAGEVAQTEQIAIEQMLRQQNFNRAATARALGISRVTLYNKIRKYQIRVDIL
jgi:DNA-binding NtrC family response regulator